MKRLSWTQLFQAKETGTGVAQADLFHLDDILYELWALGRNIILVWAPCDKGMDLLVTPHYTIGEAITETQPGHGEDKNGLKSFLHQIVSGPKMISRQRLGQAARLLDTTPRHVALPFTPGQALPEATIDSLIKRYSITLVEDRAVALFDIVGFSHYAPLAQVTQLNSLSYSVNTAYSKLLDQDIQIRFARTNTGDGFYIWNRDRGIHSNVDLYHFMHLVLAENAVARDKTQRNTAPFLRTCFHVGGHYEFYQSEGLNPTTFSYIVGDVTIELARMSEKARAGQILMGDFKTPMFDPDTGRSVCVDTIDFIRRAHGRLSRLGNLVLGGDAIGAIRCYLTGNQGADGDYQVNRYLLSDKHGYTRRVYNAKVNIHRRRRPPIYLGIQGQELTDFGVSADCIAPGVADTGSA